MKTIAYRYRRWLTGGVTDDPIQINPRISINSGTEPALMNGASYASEIRLQIQSLGEKWIGHPKIKKKKMMYDDKLSKAVDRAFMGERASDADRFLRAVRRHRALGSLYRDPDKKLTELVAFSAADYD